MCFRDGNDVFWLVGDDEHAVAHVPGAVRLVHGDFAAVLYFFHNSWRFEERVEDGAVPGWFEGASELAGYAAAGNVRDAGDVRLRFLVYAAGHVGYGGAVNA